MSDLEKQRRRREREALLQADKDREERKKKKRKNEFVAKKTTIVSVFSKWLFKSKKTRKK